MVAGMTGSELRDLNGPSAHGPHWSLSAERMKAGAAFIALRFPVLYRYDADEWLAVKVPMVTTNEGVEDVSAGHGRGGS